MSGNQSCWVTCLVVFAFTVRVWAQESRPAIPERIEPSPRQIANLAPVEHLNDRIPLALEFENEEGHTVRLSDFVTGTRPVILNLGYYRCPMLCGLIINGLIGSLKELSWTPGDEFEIVTLSFDAEESPPLARLKKQNVLKEYGRPSAAAGWHFLVGNKKNIEVLCQAVGYRYVWDEGRSQFAHAAVLIVLTPDGRISRYLYGVQFAPQTLRLSLVEASEGKAGSSLDQVLLYCFHYNANEGRYAIAAQRIMSTGGAFILLVMAVWLMPRWVRDKRLRKAGAS